MAAKRVRFLDMENGPITRQKAKKFLLDLPEAFEIPLPPTRKYRAGPLTRRQARECGIQLPAAHCVPLPMSRRSRAKNSGAEDNAKPVVNDQMPSMTGDLTPGKTRQSEMDNSFRPFWKSRRQATIIPVSPLYDAYAMKVKDELLKSGFACDVELVSGDTMKEKIRRAELALSNFILVVGENELSKQTANVRTYDNKVIGERNIAYIKERFKLLLESRAADAGDQF